MTENYDNYSFRLNDCIQIGSRALSFEEAEEKMKRFCGENDTFEFVGKNLPASMPRDLGLSKIKRAKVKPVDDKVLIEVPLTETEISTGSYADAINRELGS